jgi:hypothetical protein
MPDSSIYHIDTLLDLGDIEKAYDILKCKNPRHKPKDKACNGCELQRIETIKSMVKVRQTQIKKNPYIVVDSEAPPVLPNRIVMPCDIVRYHCSINDYISQRKNLQRIADSLGK